MFRRPGRDAASESRVSTAHVLRCRTRPCSKAWGLDARTRPGSVAALADLRRILIGSPG